MIQALLPVLPAVVEVVCNRLDMRGGSLSTTSLSLVAGMFSWLGVKLAQALVLQLQYW